MSGHAWSRRFGPFLAVVLGAAFLPWFATTPTARAGPDELFSAGLAGPTGLVFDGTGDLLVSEESGGNIVAIAPDGTQSELASGFSGPSGLAYDSTGVLYVSDDSDSVFSVSADGLTVTSVIGPGAPLSNPNAIAFDADDNLYVANAGDGSILKFDAVTLAPNPPLMTGLNTPQALVVDDGAGVLYLTDYPGTVYSIDLATGTVETIVATARDTQGGLALASDGTLYMSEWSSGSVWLIDPVNRAGRRCVADIPQARGIALDPAGQIYVTSYDDLPSDPLGAVLRSDGCTEPDLGLSLTADKTEQRIYGSDNWPTDRTVEVTVNGSQTSTSTVTGGPWSVWDLGFGAGDELVARDGYVVRTLVVGDVEVTSIDATADTVSGTATAGTTVNVAAGPTMVGRQAVTDGSGHWIVDYAGALDITPATSIVADQDDGDHDATRWSSQTPYINIDPISDEIWLTQFEPSAPVDISVDGATHQADIDEWGNGYLGIAGITAGTVVDWTVDAMVVKSHTVTPLTFTGQIDGAPFDTLVGTADAGTEVCVVLWGGGEECVATDGNGDWSYTFQDADQGAGAAKQYDDDGDSTQVHWGNSWFLVDRFDDYLWGHGWLSNSTVTISVGGVEAATASTDESGYFGHQFDASVTDLLAGQQIVVDDGNTTRSTEITSVDVTDADPISDIVTGTAPANSWLWADIHGADGVGRMILTDAVGDWEADFSQAGVDAESGEPFGSFDITIADSGYVHQFDDDGDVTHDDWYISNPSFTVETPNQIWSSSSDWTLDSTVTINVDDADPSSDTLYEGTAQVVSWGPNSWELGFSLDTGDFVIEPDHVVTVADGNVTRLLVVARVDITEVDTDAETVAGVADPGTTVHVSMGNNDSGANRLVEANPTTGAWLADFSTPAPDDPTTLDLGPGYSGSAQIFDDDLDSTHRSIHIPNPTFTVDQSGVWGQEFLPNTQLSITLNDVEIETPTTDEWGSFGIGYDQNTGPHFVVDDVVSVSDGATTKDHTVTALTVTSVDTDNETITGTAAAGSGVAVWVHDTNAHRNVIADSDTGIWIADFDTPGTQEGDTGTADLVAGSNGNSGQWDDDGDATFAWWGAADPTITASVSHDEIWATNWPTDPAGMLLHFRLDDPDTADVDVEGDMPLLVTQGGTEAGDRSFGLYDIEPGWELTVRNRPFDEPLGDGIEHRVVVSSLEVTDVDADLDTISGYADPADGDRVCVWSNDQQMCSDDNPSFFTWDPDGTWVANFGLALSDVKPGHWNSAEQYDADGDSTHFWWNLPPWIVVELAPEDESGVPLWPDAIRAEQWSGPTVALTINGAFIADIVIDNPWQNTLELPGYDIDAGDLVTLSDGIDTKWITVETLSVDHVNFSGDTPPNVVYGSAQPERNVRVELTASIGGRWAERWVNANGVGDWLADFDVAGQGWREQWTVELGGPTGLGRHVRIEAYDDDNDRTEARHCEGLPRIEVSRFDNRVTVYDYPAGTTVTIEIDDPDTAQSPDYIATGVSMPNPDNPCETIIEFTIVDYLIPETVTVTASDGDTTVTHDTIAFTIDLVDPDADTISGSAPPGTDVFVEADGHWRYPVTDETGVWVADFSTAVTEPGEPPLEIVDLGPGSSGRAIAFDAGGNTTELTWRIPASHFQVDPSSESLWANEFDPNSAVTVTVDQGAGPVDVPGSPFLTDDSGHFSTGFDPDELDIAEGDVVVVTDGTSTKDHTVANLAITDVIEELNTVSGIAEAHSYVWVGEHQFGEGIEVQTDEFGIWTADFTGLVDLAFGTQGNASQCDDDNDCTQVPWFATQTSFVVQPESEGIWGIEFAANSEVTVAVNGVPVPGSPLPTGPNGGFGANFDPADLDIKTGDLVEVSDDDTTHSHIVTNVAITAVDVDNDSVSGVAVTGTEVCVEVWGHGLTCTTATNGTWTVFTNVEEFGFYDLRPGDNLSAIQADDDGDTTERYWRIRAAQFQVDPIGGSIWANEFEPNDTITITIDDVNFGPFGTNGDGNFDGNEYGLTFDVAAGSEVSITDGTNTKDHTVTNLVITDVDVDFDTITGTADPNSFLQIWVHDESNPNLDVQADEFGNWTADFTGLADIQPGSNGNSAQCDDDNDCTTVGWSVPNARFQVDPMSDQMWINEFAPNSEVAVTVNGATVPGSPFGTDDAGNAYIGFDPNELDLMVDDLVVVTDGTNTKDHTVTNLTITDVDVDANIVSGTADPYTEVCVDVWGWGQDCTTEPDGTWSIDTNTPPFNGGADLQPGDQGSASQPDPDGDSTSVFWRVANAQFEVEPFQGSIRANEFEPNDSITITIDGAPAGSFPTDENGNFNGDDHGLTFAVPAGSEVMITDGTNTKDHTVTNLVITDVDVEFDRVTGTADPHTWLQIWVHDGDNTPIEVQADASGDWTADFSATADLVPGSNGNSVQCDDDNDCTTVGWWVPASNFQVDPFQGSIWVNEFEPNDSITITIDDVNFGPFDTNGDGNFDGNEYGLTFDVAAGSEVMITDGTNTKDHTVTNLVITDVDVEFDRVTGTADPHTWLQIWVHDGDNTPIEVQADASGDWTADFSATADLVPGSNGNSVQCDDDNDCTTVGWWAANPTFSVETPQHVWSSGEATDWVVETVVTVTVDDDDPITATLFEATTTVEEWGFYFNTDPFVIEPDHVVTVTDGDTVKTLIVSDVHITNVDEDADKITGTAPPEAWVEVDAGNEFEGAHRSVQADEFGNWTADFANPTPEQPGTVDLVTGVGGSAQVFDDDGDSTHRGFQIAEPITIASAVLDPTEPIQVGETVTLTIEFTGDANAAYVDWGDGSDIEEFDAGGSPATADHAYLAPGVYTVETTVTGHDGSHDTVSPGFVVAYDPTGGSISVNGSIQWPDHATPAVDGTAKVGASAKYKNGAPHGNFKFEFKPDDGSEKLTFKEASFDTLVIAPSFTYLRGTGTFKNDPTLYTFRLTAIDGNDVGRDGDVVRIVILDGSSVVWDSQPGEGAGAIPTTLIETGQVKVRVA